MSSFRPRSSSLLPVHFNGRRWRALVVLTVTAAVVLGLLLGAANGASGPPNVYHVWCGDWDATPTWDANPASTPPSGAVTATVSDRSVVQIGWGAYNGHNYVSAKLSSAPHGDHIALYWVDNQNGALYQCGDSHGYGNATVWPNTTQTWTAGVPILAPPRCNPTTHTCDATAVCVGYLVWNSANKLLARSPTCTHPWTAAGSPAPPPGPPVSSAPPGCAGSAKVLIHRSRRRLHNGQNLVLFGQVVCNGSSSGVLVELQGLVRPRHWLTFGVAVTCSPESSKPGTCSAPGDFSYTYPFTMTTGVQTYWLRARLPVQVGFSGHATASKRVRVRVTG